MNAQREIERIRARRATLREDIASERKRPHPEDLTIRRLKAERCRLKDALVRIEHAAVSAVA